MLPDSISPPPSAPQKPEITERQAKWHVHTAGIQAQEEARAAGAAPEAMEAVMDAASGGRHIGRHVIPPVHAGLMIMLGRLDAMLQKLPHLNNANGQLAGITLGLLQPEKCWSLLSSGDAEGFEQCCWTIMKEFTLRELKQINDYVNAEIASLQGDAEEMEVEPKKSPADSPPA